MTILYRTLPLARLLARNQPLTLTLATTRGHGHAVGHRYAVSQRYISTPRSIDPIASEVKSDRLKFWNNIKKDFGPGELLRTTIDTTSKYGCRDTNDLTDYMEESIPTKLILESLRDLESYRNMSGTGPQHELTLSM